MRDLEQMVPCPRSSWSLPEAEILHHTLFWPKGSLWSTQPETTLSSHGYWMDLKEHKKTAENIQESVFKTKLQSKLHSNQMKSRLTLYLPLGVFVKPLESSFMGQRQACRLGLLWSLCCKSVIIHPTVLQVCYHLFGLLEKIFFNFYFLKKGIKITPKLNQNWHKRLPRLRWLNKNITACFWAQSCFWKLFKMVINEIIQMSGIIIFLI